MQYARQRSDSLQRSSTAWYKGLARFLVTRLMSPSTRIGTVSVVSPQVLEDDYRYTICRRTRVAIAVVEIKGSVG